MIKHYKMNIALAFVISSLLSARVANAAVTLTFEQQGNNVTATWSGTYDFPGNGSVITVPSRSGTGIWSWNAVVGYGLGSYQLLLNSGTNVPLAVFPEVSGSYSGDAFGFVGTFLFAPPSQAADPNFSPSGTFTWSNTTLAAMQVSNFNNTLGFTGNGSTNGSREIRFTTVGAVPEPSSSLLAAVGVFALSTVRRRKI